MKRATLITAASAVATLAAAPIAHADSAGGGPFAQLLAQVATISSTWSQPPGPGSPALTAAPVPEQDPFYAVPRDVAGYRDGDVIRSRAISASIESVPIPARAWQLLYRTEDRLGRPTATVTTLIVPLTAWTGAGQRPLLSYQTAEDGVAGKCAPSYGFVSGPAAAASNSYSEQANVGLAIQRGWAVSVPDYEGPQSEFLVGGMQAKGVLDGIRASENFGPAQMSHDALVGLWGYSGGGLATLQAAQTQSAYAPELKVAGVVPGAPATDIKQSIDALSGSYAGGAVAMGINGFLRAYPELDIEQYLTKSGSEKVAATAGDCIANAAARYPQLRVEDLEAIPHALDAPPIARMLRESSPLYMSGVPTAPVYHYHAQYDELAPFAPAEATMRNFCRAGVPVQDVSYPVGGHLTVVATGVPAAMNFLSDRFSGAPVHNDCGTLLGVTAQGSSVTPANPQSPPPPVHGLPLPSGIPPVTPGGLTNLLDVLSPPRLN